MELDIPAILSTLSVIITAWFTYNQYTKDKMTDFKIDKLKKEEEERGYKRAENSGKVFGEIWSILFETKADRVYIVQPHPLGHIAYYSIQFEAKSNGIEGMLNEIQELPMSDVPAFSKQLADNLFMYIDNIDEQIEDKVAKSLLYTNGCNGVIIKRLNSHTDWVGSIFCEYIDGISIPEEEARLILHKHAMNIQYKLPPVRERKS